MISAPPQGREGVARRGGFLDRVDGFDAAFFGISPREAVIMDPQQRLMLELCWEALERAMIVPRTLRGSRTGVFFGAIADDYATLLHALGADAVTGHTVTGLHRGIIANRVSYALALRGPSLVVDSAQSSSLVAVHLACESLRKGESDVALAGGVNLNLAPGTTLALERFGSLSPDERCFTFDARANGYVRGEGGGVVVLKSLRAAIKDGDTIHCVIRGGAVNNDGGGETLPTPDRVAQAEALTSAYDDASTSPACVQYVELHGSGTAVGDPVEAAALGAVLGPSHSPDQPVFVGSVKTNIGHLEGAAGIAGLIKTVLCIERRELAPSLNFRSPPAEIPLDDLHLRVRSQRGSWPRPDQPLVAGVSSFGMGGTNCHLVLSDWTPAPAAAAPNGSAPFGGSVPLPWVVSGRGDAALRAYAARLRSYLLEHPEADPASAGRSLALARSVFEHRAVVLADDRDAFLAGLEALAGGNPTPSVVEGTHTGPPARVAFVFPGQGSQWPGMATALLESSPVFAHRLQECADALQPYLDWSLMAVLRGTSSSPALHRDSVIQPALWAVMVSLADLWRSAGVEPAAVIGHSQGEIAAATAIGALSVSDGARLVALRSRLLSRISGRGGLLSVGLPADRVSRDLREHHPTLSIAAINGPDITIVAGDSAALDALTAHYGEEVRTRRVPVDYASHSPHVEELREELQGALAGIAPRSAAVPFYSTVTRERIDTRELDAEYWFRNLRAPVQFGPTIDHLLTTGHDAFVEVSPHPVLTTGIQQSIDAYGGGAAVLGTLRRDDGDVRRFLTALGEAFTQGVEVTWTSVLPDSAPCVDIPTYPFQRRSFWVSGMPGAAAAGGMPTLDPVPAQASHLPPTPVERFADDRASQLRDRLTGLTEAAANTVVLDLVRAQTATVLGEDTADAVRSRLTFKELGLDSTMTVDLRNRLVRATGVELPTSLLYDHPNPAALATALRSRLLEERDAPATPAGRGSAGEDPIAIVGMACRFPGGVHSPEALWDLVAAGKDGTGEFPVDRGWNLAALYDADPDRPGTTYVRSGGFLYDAGDFDAEFFGISPREALAMDPQQRLLLETSWEAVERAGLDPSSLRASDTGVFVGAMPTDYGPRLAHAGPDVAGFGLTGTTSSMISGRIAYVLGLGGPAITVDTACSSSLVALHQAAQALRRGECSLALTGGITVMATPGMFVEFSRQRGLAPDGRCKPFSAHADGTAWAEGAGMLVVERLSDALANGHPVLAVLTGSAVNSDGASNGLTAPNGAAQQRVIRAALADAGLTAEQVDAVEAHGTGTVLGDPIEAQALLATYGRDRDPDRPLWLGSLKSNTGHTQAAAGVGGVIKMVQAMRHGILPRTLHATEPSPHVDWRSGAVSLLAEARPWPTTGEPRRAAVSSFGISGTNAHVILEQVDADQAGPAEESPAADGTRSTKHLAGGTPAAFCRAATTPWLLSGHSSVALKSQAARLADIAVGSTPPRPADVGLSLAITRSVLKHRAVVLAEPGEDGGDPLAGHLSGVRQLAAGHSAADAVQGIADIEGTVAFVFPGQGSQWQGMAVELLEVSPAFAARLAQCAQALAPHVDWSLQDVLCGADGAPALDRVDVVQPVLWAVMVSLAEVWRSCGVQPAAVVGHSQGEIAAATVAGALSLSDAAKVSALRAKALLALAGQGGMVSVADSADAVRARIASWGDQLSFAVANGPRSTVVSGAPEALEQLLARCEDDGVRARRIAVDYASHSSQVEGIRTDILRALDDITPRTATIPFVSTVTGGLVDGAELDATYWYDNLRRTVRFEDGIRALLERGYRAFVEVSPHPVLTVGVGETIDAAGATAGVFGSLRRDEGGPRRFLASLAEAWTRGVVVDWTAVFAGHDARRVELPTYSFQRSRYWLHAAGPVPSTLDLTAADLTAPVPMLREHERWDVAESAEQVSDLLVRLVSRALGMRATDLDVHERLQNLGMDSLIAMDIREAIRRRLGVILPLVTFLDGHGVASLADVVLSLLGETAAADDAAATVEALAGAQEGEPVSSPGLPALVPDPDSRYEPFPLTDLQQAYLVGRTDAFELGNVSTYFFMEVDVEGLDVDRLTDTLRSLIGRHDMLRAVVGRDGLQRVLAEVPPYEVSMVDLTGCPDEAERRRRLDDIHEEMRRQVFDTEVWPLIDVRVTRIDDRTSRLHVGFDALIMDGWSTALLLREWAAAYRGDAPVPPELPITYRDYVLAARSVEGTPLYERSMNYWHGRVAALPPAPDLPLKRNPATLEHPEFTHRAARLGPEAWMRFKKHAAAAGITPSAALCTAYAQVLAGWSKSPHFTLNLLVFNRLPLHPDVSRVLGNFSATSLLEVDSTATDDFARRAERIQQQLWRDLEHGHVNGVQVLRLLNRARGGAGRANMPVVFASILNSGQDRAPDAGVVSPLTTLGDSGREVRSSVRTPQVWLDHQAIEEAGELVLNWDAVEEIFPDGMIDAMFGAYLDVVLELCDDEAAWRRPAPALAPSADLEVRNAANSTAAPVPQGLLHAGFLAQAAARPEAVAVIAPGRTLNYDDLDRMSNRLDHWLRRQGVRPRDLVAIVMEKGWEQVVAALSILKAGGAYVPIDAGVPAERLRLLLESAGISVVLTQSWVAEDTSWPEKTVRLSVDGSSADKESEEPLPPPGAAADDLAYVIFTSGSTGVPKGVMIEHTGAVNTIRDINDRFGITQDDRVLGLSAFNFDLSVYDVFGILAAGGALVLPEPQAHREPGRWADLVAEHRVTVWDSVPALMQMFTEHVLAHDPAADLPLRVVMMSGDWIPVTLPDTIRQLLPDAAIWSLGGATEASIWSILYPIDRVDSGWASVPYGKPMRNQRFHVLNQALQPCPPWVPGDLYIAGIGLARGYLNDPAKTRAAFFRHPATGERLYRTGDLGRYLPGGDIEFLGREDSQVKVQGYRIELGEVEAGLLRCPSVCSAVAVAAGDRQGSKRLVAYVVLEPGRTETDVETQTESSVQRELREFLPEYLVPARIVILDDLPLSANGKVDRAALPSPDDHGGGEAAFIAPRDEIEAGIAEIWSEFFDADPIGVTVSFFDLGGDSLLAVRLMAQMQSRMDHSLPLSTLFACPTIELLAEKLRGAASGEATGRTAIVPIRTEGTRTPLVFVHPVGGDVLCYAELAALLGDDQPFYAVQVPDTDAPMDTVGQMAAQYMEAITAELPQGPYRLGGWSMGGVIALEIARQLTRAGGTVELVLAIDLMEAPGSGRDRPTDDAALMAWFAGDLAGLAGREWKLPASTFTATGERTPLEVLYSEARRASVLPPDIDIETLRRIIDRFSRNCRALLAHDPQPYEGRVRFFRAEDGATMATAEQWQALCPGDAQVIDIPGDHYTLMRVPHVRVLATALGEALDER